jgi:alkanesulfonate monooxygenase SsuD/methylene tetrahydromethanopterin reductase-like flavin-dependent oxidoreductase (luciferase family)
MPHIKFGWAAPIIGAAQGNRSTSIFIDQQAEILPVAAQYFDSVWVFDHFFGVEERSEPFLECWTTLTWLATRFPKLQIGTLVMGVGYRNPALVAKMAATLQTLSGGRLVLGLGAGWYGEEYRAYGYHYPQASARVEQLDEAVEIIRRMWTETAPSYKGIHFEIREAYCLPSPDPPPHIMIGGGGEQLMLPLIARQANWWNIGKIDVQTYERKRNILHG